MKKVFSLVQNKRSITGLFLLATLISTTYKIQENSTRMKRLTNFENGMQTCFSRVNQTYTAKLLADTASQYLTQNFQNLTEECFAEGILNVEDSFKNELSQTAKKLSTLASNVHWFHEDILSPESSALAGSTESRDVGARFEKIETTKDEILESSEVFKAQMANELNTEKTLFYISATLLVIVMMSEYINSTRRRLSNLAREKEAQAELMDNGGVFSVKVGDIIRTALEQNELINCSKLFSNFHAQQTFDKNLKSKNKFSLEDLVTPGAPKSASEVNENIDKIWNDDSIGVSADNSGAKMLEEINLESMCSSVVDMLAEKLFSQGIQLDIKIPENIMVKARSEELEQSIFHMLNFAINATVAGNVEKSLSIVAHRLGDIVAFDLIYSGTGFEAEILKHRAGIDLSEKALDLDLEIAQALLKEIEARVQLDNKLSQSGDVAGGRIKVIFKGGAATNARLVDLKVGSKKDILASLSAKSTAL